MIVKSRGITFQQELVPKVWDGTKTVTRRTWGLEFVNQAPDAFEFLRMEGDIAIFKQIKRSNYQFLPLRYMPKDIETSISGDTLFHIKCPYGRVGDGLYLKEIWKNLGNNEVTEPCPIYKADYSLNSGQFKGWRSPRFMPRWASRKDMVIKELEPVRLQDITEEEAKIEGFDWGGWTEDGSWQTAKFIFAEYWGSKYYTDNWWVWRIGW